MLVNLLTDIPTGKMKIIDLERVKGCNKDLMSMDMYKKKLNCVRFYGCFIFDKMFFYGCNKNAYGELKMSIFG